MQVNLYYTFDDEHKLHKTIVPVHNCVGSLKDECSLDHPSILLETAEATASRANYMSITDLDIVRYYFIRDWTMYRDGLVEVNADLDPLMTYETQIRALECTIARNQITADSYLYDDNYKIDTFSNIVTKKFPNGFTDESMILLTSG